MVKTIERKRLKPISVTTDGLDTVRKAFEAIFPNIIIQRCLFHIKLQGRKWLRIPPRTKPVKDLSLLVNRLVSIDTERQKSQFIQDYNKLVLKHRNYFKELSKKLTIDNYRNNIRYNKDFEFNKEEYNPIKDTLRIKTSTEKDLDKAYRIIKLAYPEMFHYLKDNNIAKTTSPLEGYFKQIQKLKGFDHNGLTKDNLFKLIEHKIAYDFNKKSE